MAGTRPRITKPIYECLGAYGGKDGHRFVFRKVGWPINRFVVVKLFGQSEAFSVEFWKGSLDKSVQSWNMRSVELDFDKCVTAQAKLGEVLTWLD